MNRRGKEESVDIFNTSCPIAETSFTHRIGRYLLTVKVGNYYEFNSFVHSNQNHYHDCHELVMVIDGYGDFEHEGEIHRLNAGDIYVSGPYESHEIHIEPSEAMGIFYLFFQITSDAPTHHTVRDEDLITNYLLHHKPFVQHNEDMLAYIRFIDDYGRFHEMKEDRWLISHLVNFIFQSMERLSYHKPPKALNVESYDVNIFEVVLDYIDEHIETKLTASNIAEEIGISRRTLYKMFERNMEKPVHDYIKGKKVELAKHYLLRRMPVTEVAGLVGFDSIAYFSRVFKAYTGKSPRTFVKESGLGAMGAGRRLV